MIALAPTSEVATRAGAAKASPVAARSQLPTGYAHQRGRALNRALSHGHSAHVRVCENSKDKSTPTDLPNSCVTHLLKTGAGLRGRRPFQPHSHWSRFPSRAATNCGVSCAGFALPRINSTRIDGSNRLCARTLAHQQTVNLSADALHSQAVLSSSLVSAGSNNASRRGQGRGRFTRSLDHSNQELGASIQAIRGCHD